LGLPRLTESRVEGKESFVIKNCKVSLGNPNGRPYAQAIVCCTNQDTSEAADWVNLDCNSTMISKLQWRIGDLHKGLFNFLLNKWVNIRRNVQENKCYYLCINDDLVKRKN
jgi:hypothetical protein